MCSKGKANTVKCFSFIFLVITLALWPNWSSASTHKDLVQTCIETHQIFQYGEFLKRMNDPDYKWSVQLSDYSKESGKFIIVLGENPTPIIGGLLVICHMYNSKTASAFFEHGEFGLYGKGKTDFFEYPKFTMNDEPRAVYRYMFHKGLLSNRD